MTLEDFRKLHKNDYVYFKYRRWDDEPYHEYVGFILSKGKKNIKVYPELSFTQDKFELENMTIYPEEVFMKLELDTLLDQIEENYPEILL